MKKIFFSWMNSKLDMKSSSKHGDGVFTRENIKKGELLAIFGGRVMTLDEEERLPKKYRDTGLQIHENFVLTSGKKKECTDFFNHSCQPNAGFKGQIFLVAMQRVHAGNEITFDYAMVLHHNPHAKPYEIICNCGRKRCRKRITDNDWKDKALQKRYCGYFQQYIQEKIK